MTIKMIQARLRVLRAKELKAKQVWRTASVATCKMVTKLYHAKNKIAQAKKKAFDEKREAETVKKQAVVHLERMKGPWYKWTEADNRGIYQMGFSYNLPTADGPGKVHVFRGQPVACHSGFHAVKAANVHQWHVHGRRLFEVSVGGKYDHRESDKSTFQRMTFLREIKNGSAEWEKLGLPVGIKL